MWVRSQGKVALQNFDGFSIDIEKDKLIINGWKGTWMKPIGQYSVTTQAMEVIDEIQERINEGCPFVYQMPEDGEKIEIPWDEEIVLKTRMKELKDAIIGVRGTKQGTAGHLKAMDDLLTEYWNLEKVLGINSEIEEE